MARRGPTRVVVATLPDGRRELACGHRIAPPANNRRTLRMRCYHCPETHKHIYDRTRNARVWPRMEDVIGEDGRG